MALDISTLQEFVKLNPGLLTKLVRKQTIVQRLSDIKKYPNSDPGPYKWRVFEPISNPGGCCRVPTGNSKVTERITDVICILDGDEYCETDLSQILRDGTMRYTAGMESAGSIEQVITEGQISAFLIFLEKLIFLGDVDASPEDFKGQNLYDGLIKIATNEGTVINATDGDIYDVLSSSIGQLPVDARKQGRIGVFVGEEYGDYLQASYIKRNWYHFNPGTYDAYSDNRLFGFGNITIIPTPGLTGTNKILITPINNIVYFTDLEGDKETLDWDYSKYHQLYYWRIKDIFGIDLAIPEWAIVVNVDPDVLTNCPLCSGTTVVTTPETPAVAPTTAKASTKAKEV